MIYYLKKFALIILIIIILIGGTVGFFYWKGKNNPSVQDIPNPENRENNEKIEELKKEILTGLDVWQANSEETTQNAIKTTITSLNNPNLNNNQQLVAMDKLLTNHREEQSIVDSDSDDGYETADDGEINFNIFDRNEEKGQTKKKELSQNYQKLQTLYQQWVQEAKKNKEPEKELSATEPIKKEIIAGLEEWKEEVITDNSLFHQNCIGCIHLLKNNEEEVAENVQLGTFQFLLKGNKENGSKRVYQKLNVLAQDWEKELKKNQSWEEEKKDWFKEKRWLSDFEIDWGIQQIKQEYSITPDSDYKFLEAMSFMYVKEAGNDSQAGGFMSFPNLLNELTSFEGELVFIPVNNPNFHWSLLVYEVATEIFYHYDTLKSTPNHKYVEPLVNELLQQIIQTNEPDLDEKLVYMNTIKQNNTYDCGVAVIAMIKRIIEKYNTDEYDISKNTLDVVNLEEFDFVKERKKLREKYVIEDEQRRKN